MGLRTAPNRIFCAAPLGLLGMIGQEFFQGLWLPAGNTVRQAIAQCTPEDRKTLTRLLNQIADQLERAATPRGPASGH